MAKLNTRFNYMYQVVGETPWERIKTLKGFLAGRKRAAAGEESAKMRIEAKRLELENAKLVLPHVHMTIAAELHDMLADWELAKADYELNKAEIIILEELLDELYAIVEPTRVPGASDEEMFELNAANEFAAWCVRELQADIIANGRPSAARVRNALSNPYSFIAAKNLGLIPDGTTMLAVSADPARINFEEIKNVEIPAERQRITIQS